MSFSGDVKRELGRQYSKAHHCQLAELAGILEMTGSITGNPLILQLDSENEKLLDKYAALMRSAFNLNIKESIEKENTIRILKAMHWYEDREEKQISLQLRTASPILLEKTCCKRAFIRGAFLAAGSISDPNKAYHFEIVCRTKEQALQLQEMMNLFEVGAKIVERKARFVVYLKKGAEIVDMLNVMEAYVSLMNLENVRILKEMSNSIHRQVNCETANIDKTANAAARQLEDIELIRTRMGFDKLPQNLREMAEVRMEYSTAPLKELGQYLDPPVGKSGVNHRLRRLAEIADQLRG